MQRVVEYALHTTAQPGLLEKLNRPPCHVRQRMKIRINWPFYPSQRVRVTHPAMTVLLFWRYDVSGLVYSIYRNAQEPIYLIHAKCWSTNCYPDNFLLYDALLAMYICTYAGRGIFTHASLRSERAYAVEVFVHQLK